MNGRDSGLVEAGSGKGALHAATTRVVACSLALCLNSGVAVCQDDKCPREGAGDQCRTVVDTDLGSMALAFGVNVVLGGLVAGVLHGARGGDFRDAVVKGVTGGALSFAGKRLAVEPFFGAGLLGREVSAVGSSIVYNASTGSPAFSDVVLPLGPVRLHVLDRPSPFAVRLDVPGTVMMAYAVAHPELSFDLESSLSNGAPIFIDDGPGGSQREVGKEIAGVLFVGRELWDTGTRARNRTISHELVHAIQYDQSFVTVGRRIQQVALTEPQGGFVGHLDWGFDLPLWWLGNLVVPYSQRPWEREAKLLVGGK